MYNLSTINEYKLHNKNTPIENLLYYTEESIYITEGAGTIAILVAIIGAIVAILGFLIKKIVELFKKKKEKDSKSSSGSSGSGYFITPIHPLSDTEFSDLKQKNPNADLFYNDKIENLIVSFISPESTLNLTQLNNILTQKANTNLEANDWIEATKAVANMISNLCNKLGITTQITQDSMISTTKTDGTTQDATVTSSRTLLQKVTFQTDELSNECKNIRDNINAIADDQSVTINSANDFNKMVNTVNSQELLNGLTNARKTFVSIQDKFKIIDKNTEMKGSETTNNTNAENYSVLHQDFKLILILIKDIYNKIHEKWISLLNTVLAIPNTIQVKGVPKEISTDKQGAWN